MTTIPFINEITSKGVSTSPIINFCEEELGNLHQIHSKFSSTWFSVFKPHAFCLKVFIFLLNIVVWASWSLQRYVALCPNGSFHLGGHTVWFGVFRMMLQPTMYFPMTAGSVVDSYYLLPRKVWSHLNGHSRFCNLCAKEYIIWLWSNGYVLCFNTRKISLGLVPQQILLFVIF